MSGLTGGGESPFGKQFRSDDAAVFLHCAMRINEHF